jgi:hypothetical protein
MGTQVIDKNPPIRLAWFGARTQEYKAFDFIANWYKSLIFRVESLDMRPPAVIVPAERYFACGGVFNGWILCYTRSDYGIRARALSSARRNGLKDNVATGAYIRPKSWSIIDLVLAIILSLYPALDLTWVALTVSLKKATAQYLNEGLNLATFMHQRRTCQIGREKGNFWPHATCQIRKEP